MDHLRAFYDIAVACGEPMPPWEQWGPRVQEGIDQQKAELWPLAVGGVMVGGVCFAANTAHIAVLPEFHGRWITKAMRRAYDTWTHAVPILAPVSPDNRKVIAMITRLGFKFSQDQGLYHLYVKEPKWPQ